MLLPPFQVVALPTCFISESKWSWRLRLGFSESEASQIVNKQSGSAQLWLHSGESPGTLRQRVTSPGGTTAAAIEKFNDDSA